LASLAIPEADQWVNLSPYESNRIIKDDFGKTEMGRDLLAQDYILKQITASLIYPEQSLGKKFWDRVYSKAQEQYGTTDIPVNTFNKVWIVPDDALIYEKGNTAYVIKNHLKVMLEEDYLSLEKHSAIVSSPLAGAVRGRGNTKNINNLGSQVVREIVLPALEKEVNQGQNFAPLRQVYSGMILAAWFKHTLKGSLLGQIYADKSKVKGVDQDPKNNEEIYRRYLQAYKKGVFNYIKEDADQYTNESIPRKYFSGGAEPYVNYAQTVHLASPERGNKAMAADAAMDDLAEIALNSERDDKAMTEIVPYNSQNIKLYLQELETQFPVAYEKYQKMILGNNLSSRDYLEIAMFFTQFDKGRISPASLGKLLRKVDQLAHVLSEAIQELDSKKTEDTFKDREYLGRIDTFLSNFPGFIRMYEVALESIELKKEKGRPINIAGIILPRNIGFITKSAKFSNFREALEKKDWVENVNPDNPLTKYAGIVLDASFPRRYAKVS